MRAMIAWWDLDESEQTIGSLRAYLREEGAAPWESVRGLCVKFWIADTERNRWGAVMLWQSPAGPGDQELPPHKAAELIGYPPTQRMSFNVEATVTGIHSLASLGGHGLAFEGALR